MRLPRSGKPWLSAPPPLGNPVGLPGMQAGVLAASARASAQQHQVGLFMRPPPPPLVMDVQSVGGRSAASNRSRGSRYRTVSRSSNVDETLFGGSKVRWFRVAELRCHRRRRAAAVAAGRRQTDGTARLHPQKPASRSSRASNPAPAPKASVLRNTGQAALAGGAAVLSRGQIDRMKVGAGALARMGPVGAQDSGGGRCAQRSGPRPRSRGS